MTISLIEDFTLETGSGSGTGVGTVTSVGLSGGTTGLTVAGTPVTGSGTMTLGGTLVIASGGTSAATAQGARTNLLPSQAAQNGKVLQTDGSDVSWQPVSGVGTVTSVDVSGGTTGLTTTGGPVTASGTITIAGTLAIANGGTAGVTAIAARTNLLPSQAAATGKVLGSNGTDVSWVSPATGTVTSVGVSGGTTGLTTSGGPVTGTGTITIAGTLAIANGGTAGTTAQDARTNLLPSQAAATSKFLQSNGTDTVWTTAILGGLAATQVAYGSATNTVIGEASFAYDAANNQLTIEDVKAKRPFIDVRAYGAIGNGTIDDTVAIQSAIAACPATGGTVIFPAGTYKITSTIVMGNGSASAKSTVDGIILRGIGGVAEIKWAGAASGTMLRIDGPILYPGVESLSFHGGASNYAEIGIDSVHSARGHFRDIRIYYCSGYGLQHMSRASATNFGGSFADGANRNIFENVHVEGGYIDKAGGFLLGSSTITNHIGTSQNTFINCSARFDASPVLANCVGAKLRFCDYNTFYGNFLLAAENPLIYECPTGSTNYPSANVFYNLVAGNAGKTQSIIDDVTLTTSDANLYLPFHTADSEVVPDYTSKRNIGIQGTHIPSAAPGVSLFGIWRNNPLHTINIGSSSTKASFTGPEIFNIAPRIPAGMLNDYGALCKIRVGGIWKADGSITPVVFQVYVGLANLVPASANMAIATATINANVTTAVGWYVDCWFKTVVVGSSGYLQAIPSSFGFDGYSNGCVLCTTAGAKNSFTTNLANDVWIDTSVQCSASAAANSITMDDVSFEVTWPKVLYT